ncbi:MAG: hypothetical protein COB33_014515 [Thiotrichaceae bacterium]|nr:hypothetical protein [Thiotrichaceae bacterium]PCI13102.1 MAG: hypothetical protein COB71_07065 [Thiotrichales bacterium]
MELENIVVEDFSSFQPGRVAPHVKIEQLLTQVGGGGSDGIKFTKRIIKAAGWRYPSIHGYAKNPQQAATAFSAIRDVINGVEDKAAVAAKLEAAFVTELE